MTRGIVVDIAGQRFGRLVAVEIIGSNYKNERIWRCICDCGNEKNISSSSLRYGTTRSCGCYNKDALSNRRAGLNEDYFKIPHVENSYWAGFIAADGNIFVPRESTWQKKLSIGLSSVDIKHLERFVSDIGYTGSISSFTNGRNQEVVSVQITSNKICEDLTKNFNIIPNKSKVLEPPYNLLDDNLIKAFIRGYIDGDGSIGIYRNCPRLSIVGTKKFLEWIRYKLRLNSSVTDRGDGLNYMYVTGTKCRTLLFELRELNTPFLVRKWNKTALM